MITLYITFNGGKMITIEVNRFKIQCSSPSVNIPDILVVWDNAGKNAYRMSEIALVETA